MFNNLFSKYKAEILGKCIKPFRDWRWYHKFLLPLMALAILAMVIGVLLHSENWIIGCSAVSLACLITILVIQNNPKEKRISLKNDIGPSSEKRMKLNIQLLSSFGFDVENEEQLNALIDRAKEEQVAYDTWKPFRNWFKGAMTYLFVPVIALVLDDVVCGKDIITVMSNAMLTILIGYCIVFGLMVLSMVANDILNKDVYKLDLFIRDVEEIKLFKEKTREYLAEQSEESKKNH